MQNWHGHVGSQVPQVSQVSQFDKFLCAGLRLPASPGVSVRSARQACSDAGDHQDLAGALGSGSGGKPANGFEPMAFALQKRCSTAELSRPEPSW
jgi:hypothetical protein